MIRAEELSNKIYLVTEDEVDASVAIKWLVPHKPEEADIDKTLVLLAQIA